MENKIVTNVSIFALLESTVLALRLGVEGVAAENLLKVVDQLTESMEMLLGRGVEINSMLKGILEAQARQDWVEMADRLQCELIPLLKQHEQVFERR